MNPDVLVLGGGGILGEAWMSAVLAGIEESSPFKATTCRSYIGTSAGSIVAAVLCAGIDPGSRLGRFPEQPPTTLPEPSGDSFAGRLAQPFANAAGAATGVLGPLAMRTAAPAGRMLRREALRRLPAGTRSLDGLGAEIDHSGASWDGRLQVSAVEVESGRRMMFGMAGDPGIPVSVAVEASCAIPGVFRPVIVHGRRYLDGGVWSPTNMDAAAVRRGDDVLCLNPTGSLRPSRSHPLGMLGSLSRWAAAVEAAGLRRRGARVRVVSPDLESTAAMGVDLMRSGPRRRVIAAGLRQGRALCVEVF